MDPLSIAASVAGLVGLAIQVAPSLKQYFSDVKQAKQDVERYTNEIYALVEVCERLQGFISDGASPVSSFASAKGEGNREKSKGSNFETTESVLARTVASCDDCLRELMRIMNVHGWGKRLKWPVYKSQVEKIISRLSRYTQLFQFALTVEGCVILSRTPEDVTTILELQHQASSKLHEISKGIAALEESAEAYRSKADQMKSVLEGIQTFTDPSQQLDEIQEDVVGIKRQLTNSEDKLVLEWLSPSDRARERHSEIRSRRTPGTGSWILHTRAFRDWIDETSPAKLAWFIGAPGCGKSTLLSFIADELAASQRKNDIAVAYYYCDYRTQVAQPLSLALGNILRILIERLPSFPASVRELCEKCHREGRLPSPSELEDHIRAISAHFSRCFILIDAMDEFSIEDSNQTSRMTKLLDSMAASGLQVLVTSRVMPSPSLTASHVIETLSADESDIRSYVTHALHADDSLVEILDSQLEADIGNTVVEQAKGMFLLVVLHLQTIQGQVSRSGIRKALSVLTNDLSDAYDKTFEAIRCQPQSRQQLALQALMWVSSSRRPLNNIELRQALATQLEDTDLDFDNIPPTKLVLRSCCGLVAIDDPDNDASEVRLVHHTLHQYLHTQQQAWISHAHSLITQTCLSYLLFKSLSLPMSMEEEGRFSLKQFALEYWGYHAALCQIKAYYTPAIQLLTDVERLRIFYPEDERVNGLHIAASFGLDGLIPALLKSGYSVDDKDSDEETALHKASARDHPETAEVLLKFGADPNLLGLPCTTPLFIAVHNRNQRVAKTLLAKGARVDMPCEDLWTPLHKAADIGDLEMVKYLVGKGSRTNETSSKGLTALHRAAGRGHIDIMQFLLNKGAAKVDCSTRDGWTPLHGAASSGRVVAVSLLLNYGADIHWTGRDGRTVLHRAVQGGNLGTVEILIGRGAETDVMKADGSGDLPLHIAAREGYVEIINRLLEIEGSQQPQLSSVNERGWTPLQGAQLSGLYAPERCLQQHSQKLSGADKRGSQKDVIMEAIHTDDADTVCHFLGAKDPVDIESRDAQGRTLLHRAFHAGAYNTAAALLSRGADIHSRVVSDAATSGNGWQAIHFAALSGNPHAVQLCLDYDADGNARTGRQQTPFHHACRSGNEDTVRLLLDQVLEPGVNIGNEEDDQSWTPLHFAAVGGHGALLCLLVYSRHFDARQLHSSFWAHLQTCAAKAGRHEVMEIIRGFRYSTSMGDTKTVKNMKTRFLQGAVSGNPPIHSLSLTEYSTISQRQKGFWGSLSLR